MKKCTALTITEPSRRSGPKLSGRTSSSLNCPIRHLGTEEGYKIYIRIQEHLLKSGVEIRFMTMVKDIIIENGRAVGVITDKGESFYAG